MKCLILFSAIFVGANALSEELRDELKIEFITAGSKCVEEVHASADDVAQMAAKKLPNTHEGICVINCIYKKYKFQNEDGSFTTEHLDTTMKTLKDSDSELFNGIKEASDKCINTIKIESDPCMSAKNMIICVIAEAASAGINLDFMGM